MLNAERLFDECEIAVEHCAEPFEAALSGIESIEELYEKLRTTDLRETCGYVLVITASLI